MRLRAKVFPNRFCNPTQCVELPAQTFSRLLFAKQEQWNNACCIEKSVSVLVCFLGLLFVIYRTGSDNLHPPTVEACAHNLL